MSAKASAKERGERGARVTRDGLDSQKSNPVARDSQSVIASYFGLAYKTQKIRPVLQASFPWVGRHLQIGYN